jgi:hypothetical protein
MGPVEGVFLFCARQPVLDSVSDSDRDPNSIFTRSLLPLLREPGLPLDHLAQRLRASCRGLPPASIARNPQHIISTRTISGSGSTAVVMLTLGWPRVRHVKGSTDVRTQGATVVVPVVCGTDPRRATGRRVSVGRGNVRCCGKRDMAKSTRMTRRRHP